MIAAGPDRVWDALVVQASRDGEWWRLPFPAGFEGGDLKDFPTWLAPYAALATLALAAFRFRRLVGLLVLGAFTAVYYLSRADLEHAQALLVVTAALAALVRPKLAGPRCWRSCSPSGPRTGRARCCARRTSAPLDGAGGAVPPADAAAIPKVVALVQQLVPPGEPIYVAPRRSDLVSFSNPLLHFLTDRPNVLHRDVLLQAKPEEQARIVAALSARGRARSSAGPHPRRRSPSPTAAAGPSGSRALDDYLAPPTGRAPATATTRYWCRDTRARMAARILILVLALAGAGFLAVQERGARAADRLTGAALIAPDPAALPAAAKLERTARRLNPDTQPALDLAIVEARAGPLRGRRRADRRVTRAEPRNARAWTLLCTVAKRYDSDLAGRACARLRALVPPIPRGSLNRSSGRSTA